MEVQNLAMMNAQTTWSSALQLEASKEKGKRPPNLDEIHRRRLEIHVERGDHRCNFDEFLNEWTQAEHELREEQEEDRLFDEFSRRPGSSVEQVSNEIIVIAQAIQRALSESDSIGSPARGLFRARPTAACRLFRCRRGHGRSL